MGLSMSHLKKLESAFQGDQRRLHVMVYATGPLINAQPLACLHDIVENERMGTQVERVSPLNPRSAPSPWTTAPEGHNP